MADQSDVESALETACNAVFYPTGAFPAASAIGAPVRIYRGWPNTAALNTDMTAGTVNVSIWPLPTQTNTTRFETQVVSITPGTTTLTASLVGEVITLGGTIAAGQVIGILCAGVGYSYRLLGTETLTGLAGILAAMVPGATASGATVTIPSSIETSVMVVADATVSTEYGRTKASFQITLWCPNYTLRDQGGALLTPQIFLADWLTLPNGETGRMRFERAITIDKTENAGFFRRDIIVSVDYPSTVISAQTPMLFGVGIIDTVTEVVQ